MNEETKIIFRNAIDTNERVRKNAEDELKKLQKRKDFLLSLPGVLIVENDLLLKKVASLFFKNAVLSEWNEEEFASSRQYIIQNICDFLLKSQNETFASYSGILQHIFDNEKTNISENIVEKATLMIKSNDYTTIRCGYDIILILFNSEKVKYTLENFLEIIFSKSGKEIVEALNHYLSIQGYEITHRVMKILARSYSYYSVPNFLCITDVFSYVISISTEILKLRLLDNLDFVKTKEFAASFLYKSSNKGVKKFFRVEELSSFIADDSRFEYIYSVFINIIKDPEYKDEKFENIRIYATNFFSLCASNKFYYKFIEKDVCYLISQFILENFLLTEDEEFDFEDNPEKYLREKYHYYNYNLRNECSSLLCDIIKNFKTNSEGFEWLIGFFIGIFEEYRLNPNANNMKKKYGAMFMLSIVTHSIHKYNKSKFEYIIVNYILPDLKGNNPLLKSHSCYLLSFIDLRVDITDPLYSILDEIRNMINSNNQILKAEATMGMTIFLSNPQIEDKFKPMIPEIVHSILVLSGSLDIEPLTFLLDSIMQNYMDEIAAYAPELVKSLRHLILSHLAENNDKEDRVMVISGFLRSVESVVISLDASKEIICNVYNNFKDVLVYIFENQRCDFYQEALDITNSFIFTLRFIDETMWKIFQYILVFPRDEILIYPNEIADIADNYISFGKTNILEKTTLTNMFNIIDLLCMASDEDFYDDDFVSGCKIAESLILNVGNELFAAQPDKIEFFIKLFSHNIARIENDSVALIVSLELVMNVFYCKPAETLYILRNLQVSQTFFDLFIKNENRFTRVHDKKICIRFLGRLFLTSTQHIPNTFDIHKITRFFTSIFCSLPQAIEARNKLKEEENNTEIESSDYNDDASQEYAELEEDIYFSTVLDEFEPFSYISNIFLNIPNDALAYLILRNLTQEQQNAINNVLANKRVLQKV